MPDRLTSVGIDIGTTTTQLVFSELIIDEGGGFGAVPRVAVVDKRVTYRSGIHFTPLLSPVAIDAEAVRRIVEEEYRIAGVAREEVHAGAVIITGETARKENARSVLRSMEGLAGDFVVATAGSDLEGILAGKGSGAEALSRRSGSVVVNVDMGGGTSNVAVFREGEVSDTSCLNVGGRLIRVSSGGVVQRVSPSVFPLLSSLGLNLVEGDVLDLEGAEMICARMAALLDELFELVPRTPLLMDMLTSHDLRDPGIPMDGVFISGGVGDCVYGGDNLDPFAYGDLGVLLGRAVRSTRLFAIGGGVRPEETIRATVIGAGSHSVELSGSTIGFSDQAVFPMRNIPILKLTPAEEEGCLSQALREKVLWFMDYEGAHQTVAFAFRGIPNPSFEQVQVMAERIIDGLRGYLASSPVLVVLLERDMGKALGYALSSRLPEGIKVVSLDGVKVGNGDYIDIGRPLARGRVLPVVIKTLVFGY
ncbi:ethanolamine utilization protein, possible chaperonin protecting lyase from inhibition [Thermanaerovibrio velox DSM 12556]|uniref:Ethanolamine utilization protein, possible chaperonin protecting lyase from inhibition n=1 Tax=Thermanaerovibrio velox DSM 12556 TaxID=926567 RepID=H0UQ76_9BACT|nr:ethanolamine ammonia-lyase reactivating factor EutA [Thermanaerovibrio velox]EHM10714.1 ethanolamine utilization protein, possible chaperonin protecting lyase from inhibition [Thermanaerovibrio velox DSM 12556]